MVTAQAVCAVPHSPGLTKFIKYTYKILVNRYEFWYSV